MSWKMEDGSRELEDGSRKTEDERFFRVSCHAEPCPRYVELVLASHWDSFQHRMGECHIYSRIN